MREIIIDENSLEKNDVAPGDKILTRAEYYAKLGFSGSTIDRPDDPVDDEFKKHCCRLKTITEGFINYCK